MAAAAALDVEGVDGAAVEHRQGVLDRQALVQAVGVQRHLHVVLLGHPQRGVQRPGVRAHVLVHLEAARPALDQRLDQRARIQESRGQEADVDRPGVEGVEGVPQRPGELTPTPQTGPNSCPMIVVTPEASEASMIRGESRCTCVSIAPGGGDQALAGDDRGPGADHHLHPGQGVRVPGPADRVDPARAHPDRVLRTPSTGSITRTLLITRSQVSATEAAFRCSPSRAVLPNPARNSSPGAASRSPPGRPGRCRPSRTRSPDPGAVHAMYSARESAVIGSLLRRYRMPAFGQGRAPRAAGRVERSVNQPGEADGDPVPADRGEYDLDRAPGSKRIVDPAGMASRRPYAAARPKASRAVASKKWKCEVTEIGTAAGVEHRSRHRVQSARPSIGSSRGSPRRAVGGAGAPIGS